MDAKYLAEIKERERAAKPGPWKIGISALITDGNGQALFFGEGAKGNAAFIAHARTDIPALLADNAAKDQQIATLERALAIANITIQKLSGENYEYSTSSFRAQEQEAEK